MMRRKRRAYYAHLYAGRRLLKLGRSVKGKFRYILDTEVGLPPGAYNAKIGMAVYCKDTNTLKMQLSILDKEPF